MLDQAGIMMAQGNHIACERISGVNDNMKQSHYHNYYEFYYLEGGERYQRLQDELYIMKPGEIMLFSPYIMHFSYGAKDVPFKRVILYFHKDEVESAQLAAALDAGNGLYRMKSRDTQSIRRILELFLQEQENPGSFSSSYQHTLLNLLLYTLVRENRVDQEVRPEEASRMSRVIQYIHSHYYEDITLELLSQKFYISPYYLCREFKEYTNSTIIQYLNVTRIMNAQRKFMETDLNITEISRQTGFSNLTHFNRVFKQVTGMTPSGYRKSHKNQQFYVG